MCGASAHAGSVLAAARGLGDVWAVSDESALLSGSGRPAWRQDSVGGRRLCGEGTTGGRVLVRPAARGRLSPVVLIGDRLPAPPNREPDFEDDFCGGVRTDRWVAHYLPHWTTPERSAARVAQRPDGLALLIEEDQLDWRLEDAPLRVSNLQTGTFSGPLGSHRGTHRHRPDGLEVRTPTPTQLLWAPLAGRVEVNRERESGPGVHARRVAGGDRAPERAAFR